MILGLHSGFILFFVELLESKLGAKVRKSPVGGKQCILLRKCLHFALRTDFGSLGGPGTRIATPTGSVGTAWVHLTSGDVVG